MGCSYRCIRKETLAPADQRERCLEEAATFWDAFHSHHDNKFFKVDIYCLLLLCVFLFFYYISSVLSWSQYDDF